MKYLESLLALILLFVVSCCAHGEEHSLLTPTPAALPEPANGPQPNAGPVLVAAAKPIPIGAVLVSRNWDERDNGSPGYWNHVAIYAGNNTVIDSEPETGVEAISWEQYRARPYHVLIVFPRTPQLGEMAAARARSLVGIPHRKLSSVLPILERRGLNCVSVVCIAYTVGCYRPRINRPDDVFSCTEVFATSIP